jgi:raffinose/stachyose/melibiose transport system substrate-binding protein
MKMKRYLVLFMSIVICIGLMLSSCAPEKTAEPTEPGGEQSAEKIELLCLIDNPESGWISEAMEKIKEKFPQYNFVFKYGGLAEDRVREVKILAAGMASCELVDFWPQSMGTFVEADLALDLTPYLEENNGEWKNAFQEGSLELGKFNGKQYSIPYSATCPIILANKTIFNDLGIEIPEGLWTWEDFVELSKQISEKSNGEIFPLADCNYGRHFVRNGLLSIWENQEQIDQFNNGEIPFTHPNVEKVMENYRQYYENEYIYPGLGSLTTSADEASAAFKQGKTAMINTVNNIAGALINKLELDKENLAVLYWPQMGPMNKLLGGGDGYFVPSFTKHEKEAVEVLKYLTSPEIMQLAVDEAVPVNIKGVKVKDDPLFIEYSKNVGAVNGREIIHFHTKLYDSVLKFPAEYINGGLSSLEHVEMLRQEVNAEISENK